MKYLGLTIILYAMGALVYGASIRQPVRVQNQVTSAVTTTTTIPLTDYVIAWEMGVTNANADSSGNGREAKLQWSSSYPYTDPEPIWTTSHWTFGSAGSYSFDKGQYVNPKCFTNSDGILAIVTNRTYSIDILSTNKTDTGNIYWGLRNNASGANGDFILYQTGITNMEAYIKYNDGTLVQTMASNSIKADTWVHFDVVIDYATTQQLIYADGILKASKAIPVNQVSSSAVPFYVGSAYIAGTKVPMGSADDIAVYDSALTSNQLYLYATAGTVPTNSKLLFWEFTNNAHRLTSTPQFDSGMSNLFICNGSTKQPSMTTSNAWYFDGVDDSATWNYSSGNEFTNNFTLSWWSQCGANVNSYSEPLSWYNSAGTTILLVFIPTANKYLSLYDIGAGNKESKTVDNAYKLDGNFHNYTMTFNNYTNVQWYVDGTQQVMASQNIVTNLSVTASMGIGMRRDFGNQSFNGQMSHVKYWRRVLSGAEITANFNKGRTMP